MQEQLFLRAVLAEFRRLGLEEATFQQVSHLLFVVRGGVLKHSFMSVLRTRRVTESSQNFVSLTVGPRPYAS